MSDFQKLTQARSGNLDFEQAIGISGNSSQAM